MHRKSLFTVIFLIAGLTIYSFLRADQWRLLLFSSAAEGRIVRVNGFISDPHTTHLKVNVGYIFNTGNGILYHGSGGRVLKNNENAADLSWLTGETLTIVYLTGNPAINDISGHEYAVLFPLLIIPFVFAGDLIFSRRSRPDR